MKQKRKKAFLGSLIGAGIGLVSSVVGGISSKNAAERQQREQQIAQNRADTYEMANNLSAGYSNQDYANDFQKKVKFKHGGMKQYNDRIKHNKRFACGGRKKAKWGAIDTNNVISAGGSALGGLVGNLIANSANTGAIVSTPSVANDPKTAIKAVDYQERLHPNYIDDAVINNPRMFRCGGKRKRK